MNKNLVKEEDMAEFWIAGEPRPGKETVQLEDFCRRIRTEKLSQSQTSGFPDVYDWICRLVKKRSARYEYLPLNVHPEKAGSLFLESEFTDSDKLSFLLLSGFRKLFHLGMCSTGFDGEESRQKNTFQIFSNMYARVYFNDLSADIVKLEQVDIQLGTIESAKYKQAFNSLFSFACYSFLVHARYEISESEVQKLPCHRAEDVLSIIGLPTQTFGYPDVYDWIYHLDPTRSEKSQFLPLNVHCGKTFSLFLESEFTDSDKVSFFLSSGFRKLFHLGMCSTGFDIGEESRQKNMFQVFSNMYTRVYFKSFDPDLVKLEQVDIKLGTIESAKYKQAFNSLFSVACYSHLIHSKFDISESEVQKFPCHIPEDVLSIIGSGYPDVYDWICQLELGSEMYEYLPLNMHPEKADSLFLGSQFTASDKASLFLSSGFRKLFDLGECSTGIVGEESRQKNTFLVFWNLFARVYFKSFNPDLVKLEQMDIQLGTIESAKYKQAFNSLFSVACYSFLLHSSFKISESQMQKFPCHRAEDILSIIGTGAANLLLRCLSTEFTYKCIHGKSDNKGANELGISYCSSSLPGFWIINSYCSMLSMSRTSKGQIADQITSDKQLSNALSYQQLQCVLQFRHAVNVYRDFIEVRLEIDNVGCDVIRLNPPHKPIPTNHKDERHFPARICITIGPQVESHVHHVSLTKSSQNPVTNIARGKAVEATFEPPNYVPGLKISNGTSSQISIKSWVFEQSFVNRPHVNLEWILYDSTTGKEVFNYRPKKIAMFNSKTWSGDRYSKASRAFTTQGGVVFTGDEYGQPITWRVNRDLQGQTVNWVVKGDICLAYFSNTYSSAHFDIANHQFSQVVQFPLVQSTPN